MKTYPSPKVYPVVLATNDDPHVVLGTDGNRCWNEFHPLAGEPIHSQELLQLQHLAPWHPGAAGAKGDGVNGCRKIGQKRETPMAGLRKIEIPRIWTVKTFGVQSCNQRRNYSPGGSFP